MRVSIAADTILIVKHQKITWKFVILFYFNVLWSETAYRGFVNTFSNTPLKLSHLVLATKCISSTRTEFFYQTLWTLELPSLIHCCKTLCWELGDHGWHYSSYLHQNFLIALQTWLTLQILQVHFNRAWIWLKNKNISSKKLDFSIYYNF